MNARRLSALACALFIILFAGSPAASADATSRPLGCAGWQDVYTPTPNGNGVLAAVAAIPNTNQMWSVGSTNPSGYEQTLVERWDGASWTVVPSPNRPQGNNYLYGVAAAAPNDAWAVGSANPSGGGTNTLILHWDGAAWSLVPSPNVAVYQQLRAVTVESQKSVWAVGYYYSSGHGQQTLIEHWNGTIWSVVPSPNVGTSENKLEAVTAVPSVGSSPAASPVWAVGYYYRNDGSPSTLVQRWDGSSWSVVPSPDGGPRENYLTAITAGSAQDLWAVGVYNTTAGAYLTLVEHWNGQSWQVVPSPSPSPSYSELSGIAIGGNNHVWAVGSYYNAAAVRLTLTEEWDGMSWQIAPSPSPGGYTLGSTSVMTALTMVHGGELHAVGAYHAGYGPFQTFAASNCLQGPDQVKP